MGKITIGLRRLLLVLIIGIFMFESASNAQFMNRRRQSKKKTENVPVDFQLKPNYAQFLTSTHVLKGDETGVYLIDLRKPGVTKTVSQEIVVTAMMSFSGDDRGIIMATDMGLLYYVFMDKGEVQLQQLSGLVPSQVKVIDSILVNPLNSRQLALLNTKEIIVCTRSGFALTDVTTINNPDPEKPFNYLVSDQHDGRYFIIDATNKGRYRSNWKELKLEAIPDETLAHGYKVMRGAVTYAPIGENGQYLLTRYASVVPTFLKKMQNRTRTFLCANLGSSPLMVTIDEKNFYTLTYLSRDHLTFSFDYDPENDSNLIYTTPNDVKYSENFGKTWIKID